MKSDWILKTDELPSAYEEVEIIMVDGNIHKDMIVRGKYGNLEWRNFDDRSIKAWRYINWKRRVLDMGEHHIQVPKDYKTEYGYRECDYCPRYSHNNAKNKRRKLWEK